LQDKSTGATQDCVPWYGHGHEPADPAWGSAYTFIADWVRTYYHDDQIVADHYPGIKQHLESLINQTIVDNMDGLLAFSWWGDWCPPSVRS
jgi:hemoglobin-like flavoprotein